jgi:SAM-dependent methyltransferase
MNEREIQFLTPAERALPDCNALPVSYLIKTLLIKARRRLWGRYLDAGQRMTWTPGAVSDADGPLANVRNYLEQQAVRAALAKVSALQPIHRACELGCGYGRLILVLRESAAYVKGYEREAGLLAIARPLLPEIVFEQISSFAEVAAPSEPFDFAMTFAVQQHLTDSDSRIACSTLRRLAPRGYVLCVEKTDEFNVSQNTSDSRKYISRARAVSMYEEFMKPFRLISTSDLVLEPGYPAPRAGSCMLFASDQIQASQLPEEPSRHVRP